jgi:hypothetical protein
MLREILAALDAMPVRELYADVFIETRETPEDDPWPHLPPDDEARTPIAPKGAVCALGAWAAATLGPEAAAALFPTTDEPSSIEMADRLKALGWPALVVHEIVFENDNEDRRWHWQILAQHRADYDDRPGHMRAYRPLRVRVEETPGQRWQRVRAWIADRLATFEQWDAHRAAWRAARPCTTPSRAGVGLL